MHEYRQSSESALAPFSSASDQRSEEPWIRMIPLSVTSSYNLRYPYGANDFGRWQGKGLNGAASMGFELKYKFLSVRFNPLFWVSEDLAYDDYPHTRPNPDSVRMRIDRVYRYGDTSIMPELGESHLALNGFGFQLRASSESFWIGPGVRYSVMHTNNAAGFPHFAFGTDGVRETSLGRFDLKLFYGLATESLVFDDDPLNDDTAVFGSSFSYALPFVPDLTLGISRVLQTNWANREERSVLRLFEPFLKNKLMTDDNPTGNDDTNQMVSVFFDYRSPDRKFRMYGEYAIDDHAPSLIRLITVPDHSRAFVLGVQYWLPIPIVDLQLTVETADFGPGEIGLIFLNPSWYHHHKVVQGYTNRGQLMGTHMGAANAQFLSLDLRRERFEAGLFLERTGTDTEYFFRYLNSWADAAGSYGRMSAIVAPGVRVGVDIGSLSVAAGTVVPIHLNRDFVADNHVASWQAWIEVGIDPNVRSGP